MKDTIRYRNQGGVYVVWNKTGTSGGTINYPVGTYECEGCGDSTKSAPLVWAERHAKSCNAC